MPQPNKIPRPFADSGDKNSIPDSSGGLGFASWQEGFPAITGTPFAQGGVAPKRADFNGIFNALSAAIVWAQQGGVYTYDATTDYEIGNITEKSGIVYICKTANGPSSSVKDPAADTAETYWARLYPQSGTFNRMFFSQTSGNYTAPVTGTFRITLKGGGGGGGPLSSTTTCSCGTGGGEGGTLTFYETLVKNQSYAYTIGAGGAAGVNATSGGVQVAASVGGTSTITIDNATYTAKGGDIGVPSGNLSKPAGKGGGYMIPSGKTAFGLCGHRGQVGGYIGDNTTSPTWSYLVPGGGPHNGDTPVLGAGGSGATPREYLEPTAGADGFILIEYAG